MTDHIVSVFDNLELDSTQRRVASRRALALAHNRVERNLGRFLRGARDEAEFLERLALVQEDFGGYVQTASEEVGHEHPDHIAAALRDHYRLAVDHVEFAELPDEEEEAEKEKEKAKEGSRVAEEPQKPAEALPEPLETLSKAYHAATRTALSAQDFRMIADAIRTAPEGASKGELAQHVGNYLANTNPLFDAERFMAAAAGTPQTGRDQYRGPEPVDPSAGATEPAGIPGVVGSVAANGWRIAKPLTEVAGKQGSPLASAQETYNQDDESSRLVTCPECGGDGKTAGDSKCGKCKGKGKVNNFGDSMVDALTSKTAADGNTDLDGPEPKIDKRLWTPTAPGEPKVEDGLWPTERKDITEPIKATNEKPLSEIGEKSTERQALPTQEGDDVFSPDAPSGVPVSGPHTDTFNNDGQVDPVTNVALSKTDDVKQNPLRELLTAEWPADQVVEAAYLRSQVK